MILGIKFSNYQIYSFDFNNFQNPENEDIIGFTDKGNAFVVKDQSKLSNEILPTHFKHHNFSSFIRQLNMYGFKKIRNVNNQNEFSHYYFRRNMENLLVNIPRRNGGVKAKKEKSIKMKNNKVKKIQEDLFEKYNSLKQDIQNINIESNFISKQVEQFQNTQSTLVESYHSIFMEFSVIKSKRQTYNDLMCQLLFKLTNASPNSSEQIQNMVQKFNNTNQNTMSNGAGSSDNNNEQNGGSSKDDTNQSNGSNPQLEEERIKSV
ncbi:unnamed protein product (macronuclear) [Paramecium tetraurelia]|uniref:HSF-type DNA-binding domain-containing protein n=1 Tax=Paramecium tetraurelia TaxID=5888 RepID=A0D7Z9_PARTE|nr:uncharacterized protein GSPATT00014133001 [Paramecium tetraurelia]CAK79166.1 unnamed protein product [Paramecium tetraurelia]|eukprot:XP_001446563.1 hypothetical protein (macronuclear) [Paramecium tetraurelia strain d4-2]